MITGDQALTACHVAAQVHILSRPVLILTQRTGDSAGQFDWLSPDENIKMPYMYDTCRYFLFLMYLVEFVAKLSDLKFNSVVVLFVTTVGLVYVTAKTKFWRWLRSMIFVLLVMVLVCYSEPTPYR